MYTMDRLKEVFSLTVCSCTKELRTRKTTLKHVHLLLAISLLYQLKLAQSSPSGYYFDNGVQTLLRNRNLFDWQQQEKEISKELLHMLGLHHRPKVSPGAKNHKSAPKFMMELYKELQFDDENFEDSLKNLNLIHYNLTAPGMRRGTGDADLIMSFENQVSHKRKSPDLLFDFSEVPATETVTRAELRLYKYPVKSTDGANAIYKVNIYKPAENNSSKQLVVSTPVSADHSGWFDIEVTDTVTQWLIFPHTNKGLEMTITNTNAEEIPPESIGIINPSGPDELQTFLVGFFQAPATVHVRQRRATPKNQRKRQQQQSKNANINDFAKAGNEYATYNKCHREALYIRFADLKWQDWIIAPDGYAAFHCTGQCTFPLNSHMNATNHAIVQTLVSLMEFAIPLPCCTPEKMAAISVLYFDDKSSVILRKYKNMVVKTCGCH